MDDIDNNSLDIINNNLPVDERCIAGTIVQTKAYHVFPLEECYRRYGVEDGKNQLITGTVVSARISLSHSLRSSTNNNSSNHNNKGYVPIFVTVDFQIPNTIVNWDNTTTTSIQISRMELSVRNLILHKRNDTSENAAQTNKRKKSSTANPTTAPQRKRKMTTKGNKRRHDDDDEHEERENNSNNYYDANEEDEEQNNKNQDHDDHGDGDDNDELDDLYSPHRSEKRDSNRTRKEYRGLMLGSNGNNLPSHSHTVDRGNMDQWWYEDDEKLLSSVDASDNSNNLGNIPNREWSFHIPNSNTMGNETNHNSNVILTTGCDVCHRYSRLDYLLFILSPHYMTVVLRCTNENLIRNGKRLSLVTRGELFKFFGIILLLTQYNNPYTNHSYDATSSSSTPNNNSNNDLENNKKKLLEYLWSTVSISKYRMMPNLGRTGMTKERFELIIQYIRFSDQPHILSIPPNMNKVQYQWKVIDDYVKNRNQYRHEHFTPSNTLCITDTYTQYYSNNNDDNSGYWTTINDLIPMYYCKTKPESSSCEMNCCYDGSCGITLTVNIIKSLDEALDKESDHDHSSYHNDRRPMYLPIGLPVIQNLVSKHWYNTNRTIVCHKSTPSYINPKQSIRTAQIISKEMGMYFITSVTKPNWNNNDDDNDRELYPFSYFSTYEPLPIGNYKGLLFKDRDNQARAENKQLLNAFVWKDQVRRYFISTSPILLSAGKSQKRYHNDIGWSIQKLYCHEESSNDQHHQPQLHDDFNNNSSSHSQRDRTMIIPQPKVVQMFHEGCSMIDSHNYSRNDVLQLEKNLLPFLNNDWFKRIAFTLFAMDIVDTWKLYQQCTLCQTNKGTQPETEQQFYMNLAEELIDNNYDDVRMLTSQQNIRAMQQQATVVAPIPASGTTTEHDNNNTHNNPLTPITTGNSNTNNNVTIISQRAVPGCYYAHITTTTKKRKNKNGDLSNMSLQGRCRICNAKTIYICSQCKDENPTGKEPWICYTKKGKICFHQHMERFHAADS